MRRRTLLQLPLTASTRLLAREGDAPEYEIVSRHRPAPGDAGMPGRFPGRVVTVRSASCIDETTGVVSANAVPAMIEAGIRVLTGARDPRDAWAQFFSPKECVGIKVNCSGAPRVRSSPEVVGDIVRNLIAVGVSPSNIWIYERFADQLQSVRYERYVPPGVHVHAVEEPRRSLLGYDPFTYVQANFFGEEDTRSNLVRLVSERFDKIINVPNMKDHGAAGVTGCLKNIAYGNFSNVARSHYREKTNTKTFIGTLAGVEPLRSKTVLHIMDGLRGVWHGGPFVRSERFVFYPKQIKIGTDPVAMDRLLLDLIEEKRKTEGAISVWNRDRARLGGRGSDPNRNAFLREPGHIEYSGKLGLGVSDRAAIRETSISLA